MSLNVETTRNKTLNPEYFTEIFTDYFTSLGHEPFASTDDAIQYIYAVDNILNNAAETLDSIDASSYVQIGCALGEAFIKVFDGVWFYSEKPQRWVVRFSNGSDVIEQNVFNKLEKRIQNGMEDSITYSYEATCTILKDGL